MVLRGFSKFFPSLESLGSSFSAITVNMKVLKTVNGTWFRPTDFDRIFPEKGAVFIGSEVGVDDHHVFCSKPEKYMK